MAIYLLETIDWYFGLRQNDSAGGGYWAWTIGFGFFEIGRIV